MVKVRYKTDYGTVEEYVGEIELEKLKTRKDVKRLVIVEKVKIGEKNYTTKTKKVINNGIRKE